jgi:TonB family protein
MSKAPLAAMAMCWLLVGQTGNDDAIERFHRDIEANPKASWPHYQLGLIYMNSHNYQLAANEFRSALNGDLKPVSVGREAHFQLGLIFDITDQRDRALREYKLAGASPMVDVLTPTPIKQVPPEYTEEARIAGLEGEVQVECTVDAEGKAQPVRVTKSLGLGLDENATEVLKKWTFEPHRPSDFDKTTVGVVTVEFRLPEKQSRWHLMPVDFQTPEGAARPHFTKAEYPLGAGISRDAYEEGRIMAAVGRVVTAKLAFDVDTDGIPKHFVVLAASDDMWGPQAVALVREWEFSPAMKNGVAVAVPCVVDLAWGARQLPESGHASPLR